MFRANIYRSLDGTIIYYMPLEVFTQRNFVADFIPLKLNFIQKKQKNCF